MVQHASSHPEQKQHGSSYEPRIIRGAYDQAAAYEAWLAQWKDVDSEEEARNWQRIKHNLQETRRELGQRLLFPE